MAKKEDKKNAAPPKPGKAKAVFVLLLVCAATPFMLPSLVLLLAGLVPTYVAFATDSDPQKSGATSVCAMNVAGIAPYLIDLWMKGQTLGNAFAILGEPKSWLVILGAAAIGQLIVYTIPSFIAIFTLNNAESRLQALRRNLELLKDSWGADVATTKPLDKIIQG